MYIEEFENIEIKLNRFDKRWVKKLGFEYEIDTPILVNWKLIKRSTFRNRFMNVRCDDCGDIHERRLRDLHIDKNIHYCRKCSCKGDRNSQYGKPQSEGTKASLKKWRSENTNPFTWESSKKKIKEHPSFTEKYKKIRGQKRTQEVRDKMSQSAIEAFKSGRRKVSSGWGKVRIRKYAGLDYQSSYELKFIKFIESIGLISKMDRGPIIVYFDKSGKEHTYHSDFRIRESNIIFEIKSSYLWKKKLETNLLKKEAAEKQYKYHLILDNNFKKLKIILNDFIQ